MLNLTQYGMDITRTSLVTNDLIVIANIDKRNNVDTRVSEIGVDYISIEGKYENVTGYAMIGSDLVKIVSSEIIESNTKLTIEKGQYGVKGTFTVGSHFRTVVVVDDDSDIQLLSWEFEDTTGSPSSSLFPVELGTGTISVKSDLKLWSPHSTEQKYKVRTRKSIAYIFKGMGDKRVLKFTTVITKIGFNTRGKKEPNKIKLTIKTKLAQWYDKDVVINKQLKGTTPKEFFKMVFDLTDDEVYYAEGVSEESFPKINNLHTKEYSTMSELLQAYCQNGIRFCFDREEKVKIFGDFNIDGINTDRIFEYDITDFMFTEDEQMIYNTINTQSYQRQTLYNFEDLDNKYVKFFKVKRNAINSNQFMTVADNGDWNVQTLEIVDEEVHSSLQLKDYVLLKRTVEPYLEFYARVIAIESDNRVILTPLLYDKDYKLLNYGKYNYLAQYLVNNSCPMDLYYVKEELPMVFKYTRNKNGEEVDSSLAMPLLPRVDGETKYQTETNITFGCASDLKIGNYTGIVEEIDSIYGTWDSSKLLYNRELTQFSNNGYPPIFALTNKLEERLTESGTPILNYTHFDNSDFLLQVERPSDNSFDAVLKMSNTKSVNSSIDLYVGKEIGRFGNKILQVEELQPYKIGDVLIVNRPDDLNTQEETEFDETLSSIRWTITAKETQVSSDGTRKHYIYVDSNFAKRQQTGKVYEFTKFPNWSVVFLQELYFRGNPVIEYTQDVVGLSKGTSIDGDTSNELYGEKTYDIDSKQLNKENLKLLMGYILEHFQATKPENTKFTIPISVYNALDVELLDVVKVKDPVYSQIQEDMQWVVVSVSAKGGTNEMELTLLNVNSKNTEPYKIDIKDVIEYTPVEIPTYDHAGGEGNSESNNDGTGGTDTDKTLGQFWLAEVSSEKFRARVEKFEGNYIYFKDFNGEEYEQYQSKLFPVAEFAVNIKGEVIFVQSDMNYRAFIKKRRVYDTEEILIAPEDDVTFLVTTTYVDIDGTFYSRKMMVGDGDSYLSVDTINGVKVVGDFVVGENNKNSSNDLWNALQNTKTYYQDDEPRGVLKEGDLWFDTDDQNHPYIYQNGEWVSARDKIFETEGGNKVYFQATKPPSSGTGVKEGDVWFDTSNNNTQYVLIKQTDSSLKWVLASDANDKIAKGEVVINANTTFNGDATIVSQGADETTIIQGGKITFTRGGYPITVIRNMRIGSVATDGSGKGIVTFNNFKTLNVLTSIKSFNVGSNVRSLNTYANLIDPYLNKWQFFLYGTESQETASTKYTHSFSVYNTTFSISYLRIYGDKLIMRVSTDTKIGSISVSNEGLGVSSSSCRVSSTVSYSGSITKSNTDGVATIASLNGTLTGSVWPRQTGSTSWDLYFSGTYDIPLSLSSSNTKNLNTILKIDFSKFSVSWTANGSITGKPSGSASQDKTIPFTRYGTYNDARNLLTNNVFQFGYTQTEIVNTIGDGDVQYIAMEV